MTYIEINESFDKENGLMDVVISFNKGRPCLEIHALSEIIAERLRGRIRGTAINFTQNYSKNCYFHVEDTDDKLAVRVIGNIHNALIELRKREYISSNLLEIINKEAVSIIESSKNYDKDEMEITPELEEEMIKLMSTDVKENGNEDTTIDKTTKSINFAEEVMKILVQFEHDDQKAFLSTLAQNVKSLGFNVSIENSTRSNSPSPFKI